MIYDFVCSVSGAEVWPMVNQASGEYRLKCSMPDGTFGGILTLKPVTVSAAPTATPGAEFTDGAVLGWGVVAAMVAAWGITVLRRGIS